MKHYIFALVFTVLLSTLRTSTAEERKLNFVVLPKLANHVFFKASETGCLRAANEIPGVTCEYIGPGKFDAAEQVRLLEDLFTRGVDGIAISPIDSVAVGRFLSKQKNVSIPIVTFDSDLTPEFRFLRKVYVGTNNYELGYALGEKLHEIRPAGGKLALFSATGGEANLNDRIRGVRDALSKRSETKGAGERLKGENNWTEVAGSPFFNNGDFAISVRQLDDVMTAHPDLNALVPVGGWPQLLPKAYQEFHRKYQQRFVTNETVVVCADTLPEQMKLLAEGFSNANVGQRPQQMGYEAILVLDKLVRGVEVGEYQYTGLDRCTPATASSCLR